MVAMLVAFPVLQGRTTEVMDTRIYSESGKTRIAIQLDGPVQYQTQLTSEPGISISLLKTGIGDIRKTIRGEGELVSGVTLKEIAGDLVDVNISLKGDANFAVFPIESPDRIVIDITPVDSPAIIQPLTELETDPADSDVIAESVSEDVSEDTETRISSLIPLRSKDYMLAQIILNAVLVIALIIMGLKLWFVAKDLKKYHKILKKNQNFADMVSGTNAVNGMRQKASGESSNVAILHGAATHPETIQNGRKKAKKRGRNKQAASLQEQYRKVHELAQLGMDRLAISQQSNVPIGEVNLILDLSREQARVKPGNGGQRV